MRASVRNLRRKGRQHTAVKIILSPSEIASLLDRGRLMRESHGKTITIVEGGTYHEGRD